MQPLSAEPHGFKQKQALKSIISQPPLACLVSSGLSQSEGVLVLHPRGSYGAGREEVADYPWAWGGGTKGSVCTAGQPVSGVPLRRPPANSVQGQCLNRYQKLWLRYVNIMFSRGQNVLKKSSAKSLSKQDIGRWLGLNRTGCGTAIIIVRWEWLNACSQILFLFIWLLSKLNQVGNSISWCAQPVIIYASIVTKLCVKWSSEMKAIYCTI